MALYFGNRIWACGIRRPVATQVPTWLRAMRWRRACCMGGLEVERAHVDVWQRLLAALFAQLMTAVATRPPPRRAPRATPSARAGVWGRGWRGGRRRRRCGVRGSRPERVSRRACPAAARGRRRQLEALHEEPLGFLDAHLGGLFDVWVHEIRRAGRRRPGRGRRHRVRAAYGAAPSAPRRWAATGSRRSAEAAGPARTCPPEAHRQPGKDAASHRVIVPSRPGGCRLPQRWSEHRGRATARQPGRRSNTGGTVAPSHGFGRHRQTSQQRQYACSLHTHRVARQHRSGCWCAQ